MTDEIRVPAQTLLVARSKLCIPPTNDLLNDFRLEPTFYGFPLDLPRFRFAGTLLSLAVFEASSSSATSGAGHGYSGWFGGSFS